MKTSGLKESDRWTEKSWDQQRWQHDISPWAGQEMVGVRSEHG